MNRITRRQFILLALQLLAYANLPGCKANLPVLGKSFIPDALLVEDHCEVLGYWAKRKVTEAVLVNLDLHDDFRWIADSKIEELRSIARRQDWQRFQTAGNASENGLYHIANWIYAGAKLGMFKEIIWVIPHNYLAQENPCAVLGRMLQTVQFSDEDIRTFTLNENRFQGTFYGIPVTICGIEALPTIHQPILLSICMDFFPAFSINHRSSFLNSLALVFEALYTMNYQIQDAVVSYSVNGDYYLQPHHRWIGDTTGKILNSPELIRNPPSEQLNVLQQIEDAYRAANGQEMLALVKSGLSRYPTAAIYLYQAYAYMLCGDADNAFSSAMSSCRTDKAYQTALPFLGIIYYNKSEYTVAEKFFRAGIAANAEMPNGLFFFGNCLRKLGKNTEAISIYEKDASLLGNFPTKFLTFATYLDLGNQNAAYKALVDAIAGLKKNIYATVENVETAQAIYAAIDFCDRGGLLKMSAELRVNPGVRRMLEHYPRH
jgi:tetratricopeptide (TPR) repeat protein